jgi:hypothetical protein
MSNALTPNRSMSSVLSMTTTENAVRELGRRWGADSCASA